MDKFYTPLAMARQIVQSLTLDQPAIAADFAGGDGALLAAVSERWPLCQLVATDIDRAAVHGLRQRLIGIKAWVCDFLNPRSRRASKLLRSAAGRIFLVIINHPFS